MSQHADVLHAEPQVARAPHPVIWTVLYIPFGAFNGFVQTALTYVASAHGIPISESAWLNGAQMLTSWLKWLWAPLVDISLSPKRWYVISTSFSAAGVVTMSLVPLEKENLLLLVLVILVASLVNSIVGMSVESMIAQLTPKDQVGRVSAWFQAGNLGGSGLGGALGLFLFQHIAAPWKTGSLMGVVFMACCGALMVLPAVSAHAGKAGFAAMKDVAVSLVEMLRTRVGFLSALLCLLPVGTGAAQGVLTQAPVAAQWAASADDVALTQGLLAGLLTSIGCFGGGWLCDRLNPRAAYAFFGLVLAAMAVAFSFLPHTRSIYIGGNMVYAFGVGLAYAAFTAVALSAIGKNAAATGYNIYASLSNFPIWWLGLLLGWVADPTRGEGHDVTHMLLTEAALGVAGVVFFAAVTRASGQSLLERTAPRLEPTL